jgi:hypothetical protein
VFCILGNGKSIPPGTSVHHEIMAICLRLTFVLKSIELAEYKRLADRRLPAIGNFCCYCSLPVLRICWAPGWWCNMRRPESPVVRYLVVAGDDDANSHSRTRLIGYGGIPLVVLPPSNIMFVAAIIKTWRVRKQVDPILQNHYPPHSPASASSRDALNSRHRRPVSGIYSISSHISIQRPLAFLRSTAIMWRVILFQVYVSCLPRCTSS